MPLWRNRGMPLWKNREMPLWKNREMPLRKNRGLYKLAGPVILVVIVILVDMEAMEAIEASLFGAKRFFSMKNLWVPRKITIFASTFEIGPVA